jgi:glycosyltransferase involved in cell wall biosynthesis
MSVDEAPDRILSRRLPGATVLQIVPALVDVPAARAAVNIASALLRSGARAMVAGEPGMLVGQLQALGGEWVRFASATLNPFKLRRNAHTLTELVAGERIDIVHAYDGPTAWSAQIAVRETATWLVTSYAGAPTARVDFASLYQGALARAHRVISESEYAADLIVSRHGVPLERVAAVPRSIDTARFDPAAVSQERIEVLRHGWGIRPGWRVILMPGPLSPAHGQMTVIDAIRILVNGGLRGVTFVMAGDSLGDGEYARAVAERAETQGIGGLLRRVGHCLDMPAAYAMADLVIVPAVEPTTFDQVAAEAHAMAKPVIASSIGSLPEIVLAPPYVDDLDRTGWLAPPADPVALARAIAAALALADSVWHAIAARARHVAETRFAPARVAAATLGVYTDLLEGER